LLLLTLVLVPLASLACDRDDDDGVSGASCTNDATFTAAFDRESPLEPDPQTPTLQVPDNESECRLRRALIIPSDLGSGWQYSPIGDAQVGPGQVYSCDLSVTDLRAGVSRFLEKAAATTPGADERSPVLLQLILALPSGAAARAIDELKRDCDLPSDPEARSIGDAALVVEEDIGADEPLRSIWVQEGDFLVSIMTTPADPDVALEELTELTLERLRKVGDLPAS
jgi:hypothetical protein